GPTTKEAAWNYYLANPSASQGEIWNAAVSGMSPLQYDLSEISRKMVQGDGTRNGDPGARVDVKRYGLEMGQLAQGGLMTRGMAQLREVNEAPNLVPGIQSRMAGRMGVSPNQEQQAAMQQQAALTQASHKVGLANQTRMGLAEAQRNLRFGGINV
ncbi:MAG: hypothetical protein RL661_757, partial [Pseudomonadota bacterium]